MSKYESEQMGKLLQLTEKLVRPGTYPMAIKIFEEEPASLPEDTVFPKSFWGYPINFCAGMTIVRRYDWKVAFRFEDNACPMFPAFFGQKEMPEMIKDGSMCYPIFTETKELGVLAESTVAKIPHEKAAKLVFMEPLSASLSFQPDVIVVYGNASQLTKLIAAANYRKGSGVQAGPFTARGSCAATVVKPYLTKDYTLNIPGGGERLTGHTADDELAFSIPFEKVDDFIIGMEKTNEAGTARFPTRFKGMQIPPTFPGKYKQLGELFGMEVRAKVE